MDEFTRIQTWNANRQTDAFRQALGVKVAIGDDTSVVSLANQSESSHQSELLYTVDTMVEDVHFTRQTMSLEQIGYKALATNLSDIAAMGGTPLHALISISIPNTYLSEHINHIYDGIYECANLYQVAIVGGDTTSSPHSLVISITVIGVVESGSALLRSGAKSGDIVVMTGVAGQSAAGLHALQHIAAGPTRLEHQHIIAAHQRPEPQLAASRLFMDSKSCHALNDVSDGLASELAEIAVASKLDIVIEEQQLPVSEAMSRYALQSRQTLLDWVLYGGEDYILVGTVHAQSLAHIEKSFAQNQLPFYVIGYTTAGEGQVWLEGWDQHFHKLKRTLITNRGYNHFK